MSPRVLAAALVVGLSGVSASVLADTAPSLWDRAKDPRVEGDWELHVKVAEWLALPSGLLATARLEAAESWLEEAHAEASPDVRLRFDLGIVYEQLKHHERAAAILAPALAEAPDHPAAPDAWIELAYAYAYLDRSRDELVAYDAYLARTTSKTGRATALLNRAEAEMRLGHLEEAVLGYRDAITESESVSGLQSLVDDDCLARWGLAVALDRSGDATGAAREAAAVVQLDQYNPMLGPWPAGTKIGNQDSVFFVPAYERSYYLALGMAEIAKQANDPRAAAAVWAKAELLWNQYIAGAEGWNATHKDRPDRWLSFAEAHLAKTRKQRAAAERRAHAR